MKILPLMISMQVLPPHPTELTPTGTTDHVTGILEKLMIRDKCTGNDQVYTTSGAGMNISHIGHSIVKTLHQNLMLRNALYVPKANKNLISVHKLASDNLAFLEYHPNYFVIKDRTTRRPLFRGRCQKGLYPLSVKSLKLAFGVFKPSLAWWHNRLGHPFISIVERVINKFNLPCSSEFNKESVCDACQRAKSHQLPYSKSNSSLSHPLELIYSDLWGYAPKSVGGKQYYESFIDDYSRFSWIYPLKFKSKDFSKFVEFQKLVESLFDRKATTVQTDWGGEHQKLHGFFSKIDITHHVSCPYAHQQNGPIEWKHCHIVEVGLSLLAHSFYATKILGQCFPHSCLPHQPNV
jgi:hypothetical protein